ncbi:MAG TPA: S41 family peptidase [Kofleriaceae bacterium]
MKRAAALGLVILAACGGDDSDYSPTTVPDQILPSATYAEHCASPRSGKHPVLGYEYDDKQGNLLAEQLWLRSWTDELYLWYSEVPRTDPKMFSTAEDYFDVLKTPAKTASGAAKDKFHFTYATQEWEALSSTGTEAGYGLEWALLKTSPPRELVVAFVTPSSPASDASLARGTKIISIDGVDVANGTDVDTLNEGITPSANGKTHTFVVQDLGAAATRTVMMTSKDVTMQPVQSGGLLPLGAPDDKIGYILFNSHIATAEQELFDAIADLSQKGATDLVLDLRYNGGGILDLAAELGFMIAGSAQSSGKIFERETFNDKHPTTDPVTGSLITPTPFYDHSSANIALPSLNLQRIFVLTGSETCSASEAVMNGLAGIDVEVIQIGDTTCGKPYGFYPFDNCGTTYFSIQFQGNNDKSFGDYPDGFVPGGALKGCVVDDDFSKALGDPLEGRLAAALYYRTHSACPPATARRATDRGTAKPGALRDPRPAWRQNRIIQPLIRR